MERSYQCYLNLLTVNEQSGPGFDDTYSLMLALCGLAVGWKSKIKVPFSSKKKKKKKKKQLF
jgi:hypothetical protein